MDLHQREHDDPQNDSLNITMQVDPTGYGDWMDYKSFLLESAHTVGHIFLEDFSAYWVRFISDEDCIATAQLIYR